MQVPGMGVSKEVQCLSVRWAGTNHTGDTSLNQTDNRSLPVIVLNLLVPEIWKIRMLR